MGMRVSTDPQAREIVFSKIVTIDLNLNFQRLDLYTGFVWSDVVRVSQGTRSYVFQKNLLKICIMKVFISVIIYTIMSM